MKHSLRLFAVAAFALLIAVPAVFAQNMPITPEVSILPVTEPLDVGGTILQPGTYQIKVIRAADSRNKIQVLSQDGSKIFATVLAVPHELEPGEQIPSTTFVYFPPTADHPRALRTWFASNPPGHHGHDIVYQEGRAKQLAVASKSRVISYPDETAATNLETSPLSVVTPEATVETYTYTPPATTVTETTTTTQAPMTSSSQTESTESHSTEMPRTASNVPLFALAGLISLFGAVALRFVRN